MHILIIEDEKRNFNRLKRLLEEIDGTFRIDGPLASIVEAVEWLQAHPAPELIFADIRLSDGLSFDVLRRTAVPSPVIFTTAYDQYAVRAFTVNSIDYILKPIDEQRLQEAIDKYEHLQQCSNPRPDDYLATLLDALQSKEKQYRTRFLIYRADRFWSLQVSDIAYFYSENKMTFAVTRNNQEHVLDLSLNKLSEQLDPDRFFRANRQIILCIDAIDHAEPYFNGKISVTVRPPYKSKITISEEKLAAFKRWLNF